MNKSKREETMMELLGTAKALVSKEIGKFSISERAYILNQLRAAIARVEGKE